MRIFINDKPLDLISHKKIGDQSRFSQVFQNTQSIHDAVDWKGTILFQEPTPDQIIQILYVLRTRKLKKLESVTLASQQKGKLKDFVKSRFEIIKAAGGVVEKEDQILMIYRFDKWDFPKGKFEKGETPLACGLREVEEECAVQVKYKGELCNTWHTYTKDRKSILKKTYWFRMTCISDTTMKPQAEEGIEDIRWFSPSEAATALVNSYPSMRYLLSKYRDLESV
ncbi:NUDIX hydrolase [Algoriphagus namhaensis]